MAEMYRMKTVAEQLAPDIDKIGDTVAKFANPNRDVQVALRQAISQNPDLIQKLIDLGPEKVTKMFGKQAGFLGQGEISLDEQVKRDSQKQYETNPLFRDELFAGKTGTQTTTQRTKDKLDIEGKTTSNTINASQARVQQETEDAQIQQYNDLAAMQKQKTIDFQMMVNKIPDIGTIDIDKVVRDAFNGRGDAATMMRLQQAQIDIKPLIDSMQQRAQISASFSLERLRQSDKNTQAMTLKPISDKVQETRLAMDQYNNVMKGMLKSYTMAKTLADSDAKKPVDKRSSQYETNLNIVRQYEAQAKLRDNAQEDYTRFNAKYSQLVDIVYGTRSADGTPPPPIEETAPPDILPAINGLRAMSPADRKIALDEVKRSNPASYTRLIPWVSAIDSTTNTAPATPVTPSTNIVEKIKEKQTTSASDVYTGLSGGNNNLSKEDYAKAARVISNATGVAALKVLSILNNYGEGRLKDIEGRNKVTKYIQENPTVLNIGLVDVNDPKNKGKARDTVQDFFAKKQGRRGELIK